MDKDFCVGDELSIDVCMQTDEYFDFKMNGMNGIDGVVFGVFGPV